MSGHSKWSTIKRKKEKADSARAKVFTKFGRELAVAVRIGGCDPSKNSRLKDAISKARANNVPNSNIERIIKKASGESLKSNFETIIYEGYGPEGVAVLVKALTDNKNRTAANVRHYFDKFGGNLASTGCVSFMFDKKGVIFLESTKEEEESLMEFCMDLSALDFDFDGNISTVITSCGEFYNFVNKLKEKEYKFLSADIEYIPEHFIDIKQKENVEKMKKLEEALKEDEDILNIWTNYKGF